MNIDISRVPHARMRSVIAGLCFALFGSLGVAAPSSPASAANLPSPGRENVVYLYDPVSTIPTDAALRAKLAGAAFVVVGQQADPTDSDYWTRETTAAHRIAATGAVPIHYVEYIWRSGDKPVFGANLGSPLSGGHPEWRLCYPGTGTQVSAARDRSAGGWYLDINERAARAAADAYLYKLKQAGYRGLFYDIGRRTFVDGLPHKKSDGSRIYLSNLTSGCTSNPVSRGRSVAQSYLALIDNMRVNHGMYTIVNCCTPSYLTASSVRGATYLRDTANRFLNESTKVSVSWNSIQKQMAESESSGRVWTFQCAETPQKALYAWARAKMWHVPISLNTGFGSSSGSCLTAINQWGIWGELTNARLGKPLDSSYKRGQCEPGSTYLCFFWRRYTNGIVVVNNGRYTLGAGQRIPLVNSSMPSCVYLGEVRVPPGGTGDRLQYPVGTYNNLCTNGATLNAARYSGRVFLYKTGSHW